MASQWMAATTLRVISGMLMKRPSRRRSVSGLRLRARDAVKSGFPSVDFTIDRFSRCVGGEMSKR